MSIGMELGWALMYSLVTGTVASFWHKSATVIRHFELMEQK
jgi:hypothetical protein